MKISAIVLTKNEEKMITDCLNSLSFADEIIVIDDNSTDQTRNLASKFTNKIFTHEGKNFADRRNSGLTKASYEWIIYLDADERITAQLKAEILKIIEDNPDKAAYFIKRENYYLGKKWPQQDKVERLFRKDKLISWYGEVHESPKVSGLVGELTIPLIHITHRDIESMIKKTIEWSKIEAELRYKSDHPMVVWWRFPRVMLTQFLEYFIRQGGWKNGVEGWIESIFQAFSIFITYVRLWEIQKDRKK